MAENCGFGKYEYVLALFGIVDLKYIKINNILSKILLLITFLLIFWFSFQVLIIIYLNNEWISVLIMKISLLISSFSSVLS